MKRYRSIEQQFSKLSPQSFVYIRRVPLLALAVWLTWAKRV